MPIRSISPRPAAGWALGVLAWAATATALIGSTVDGRAVDAILRGTLGFGACLAVAASTIGAYIITRHPGSRIGWLLIATGVSRAIAVAALWWAEHGLLVDPGSLPGADIAAWVQLFGFLPGVAALGVLLVLYPDDRLPGRGWIVVPGLSAAALVLMAVVFPALAWHFRGRDMLGDAPPPPGLQAAIGVAAMVAGLVLSGAAIIGGIAALIYRWRHAEAGMRSYLMLFALTAVIAITCDLVGNIPGWEPLRLISPVGLFAAIGLGVFRYGLYDIDRLINRTLVYALLSLIVIGAVAIGSIAAGLILGTRTSVLGGSVAAFLVALGLQPLTSRLQTGIDRRFDRRTFEAVSQVSAFTARLGHDRPQIGALVTLLREVLEDPTLELAFPFPQGWLDPHGVPRPKPEGWSTPVTRAQTADVICVVVHREPARWAHVHFSKVLRAAVSALENARLQAELASQVTAVLASRARIVAAGDAERRRVERDLHDGAQQRLVGLALYLQRARRQPDQPHTEVLARAVDELQEAIAELRSLAGGLLPAVLASGGLPAALRELGTRSLVPISLDLDLPIRLGQGTESAAWFVVSEAVANVGKHAPACRAVISVQVREQQLHVVISDDGPGGADPEGSGLRGLADRVETNRGRLTICSPPGGGTRVEAVLPCG
jgi:signal transduction histidine kinase